MKKYSLEGLVHVPATKYDFDDVICNVGLLLDHLFQNDAPAIRSIVADLTERYHYKIEGDYWKFIELANQYSSLRDWDKPFRKDSTLLPLKVAVLDLYFQIAMVPNWDAYNDILIHAYLEDVQPFLTIKNIDDAKS
jgi:hypothetical protein